MDTVNQQPETRPEMLRGMNLIDEIYLGGKHAERCFEILDEYKRKELELKQKSRFQFFLPSDIKLVQTFLMKYIKGDVVPFSEKFDELDFYSNCPYTISARYKKGVYTRHWYFFARKHEQHDEPIRVVPDGYWKQVGENEVIVCNDSTVGCKKSFFFYKGDTDRRTFWQLAEYSIVYEDIIRSTPGTSDSVANGNTKVYDKVICKMYVRV